MVVLQRKARALAGRQLGSRKDRLAAQLRHTAANLHEVAAKLREDEIAAAAAGIAEQGATVARRLGRYLEQRAVRDVIADAEKFCRKHPRTVAAAAVASGALAVGIVRARG